MDADNLQRYKTQGEPAAEVNSISADKAPVNPTLTSPSSKSSVIPENPVNVPENPVNVPESPKPSTSTAPPHALPTPTSTSVKNSIAEISPTPGPSNVNKPKVCRARSQYKKVVAMLRPIL